MFCPLVSKPLVEDKMAKGTRNRRKNSALISNLFSFFEANLPFRFCRPQLKIAYKEKLYFYIECLKLCLGVSEREKERVPFSFRMFVGKRKRILRMAFTEIDR